MINLKRKEDCCGCNACGDVCPSKAISYKIDNEGFWYPVVNVEKCVDCGMCERVCPMVNSCTQRDSNMQTPKCYAAEHKSIDVVFSSTSGGMFSALAEAMYNEGGFVGGAVHNEDFSVSEFISNNRNDLKELRRSKDLQSNAEGFYNQIKALLDHGEKVLVCALPCQIAALKTFLSVTYENLTTVDLICAGVNSPKIWKAYLNYIEEINQSRIIYTENKAKEYGWANLTQKFVFENGSEYFDTHKTNVFVQGYVDLHLFCRPSCYECRFKGFPRFGDITIGDYWGIKKHTNNHNSDMGTSVILTNSKKGMAFFEQIKKRVNYEETPLSWAVDSNKALVSSMSILSEKRDAFFRDLEQMRFDRVVKKYSEETRIKSLVKKLKMDLRERLSFGLLLVKTTRVHPKALFQTIRYSGIGQLIKNQGIICGTNTYVNIQRGAKLNIEGVLVLGKKAKFPGSKQESRLFIGRNGQLNVLGRFDIDANAEITIFDNAELIIHGAKNGYSDANSGLRIVCGQKIEIKSDVGIGRDVMIRDTNGNNHFMNTAGYRPSRPILIDEHAWLCESCTVMPGVKVGRGAIIGTNSTVTRSIPDHALACGNPAEVVQENVLWKM